MTDYAHPTPYVDMRPGSPGSDAGAEIMEQLEAAQVEWEVLRRRPSPEDGVEQPR